MDIHKNYKPSPIPNYKQFTEDKRKEEGEQLRLDFDKLEQDPFVEIEMSEGGNDCNSTPIPSMQPIKTQDAKIRTLFYSMRQIARDHFSSNMDHSKAFYYQAIFMKDFEDDYDRTEWEPFSAYYPYYQKMSYGQLRTYFSWRTQVRKGNIADISTAYAFVYIYELLNNIGTTDPEDEIHRLMSFWQEFRLFDTVIDSYVLQWIKDYHVFYPLQRTFKEFVYEHQIQSHYPSVFVYGATEEDSFHLFAEISKYDIKKSVFYKEETSKLMSSCFYHILSRFRRIFKESNMCFEDIIFSPLEEKFRWIPFGRSLFYPVFKQVDRQVIISEKEVYYCRNNNWSHTTVILSESGRQLIGYVMKEMESLLRKQLKFKHKITANVKTCHRAFRAKLQTMGISFPQFIEESVAEFYRLYTRREVSVNLGELNQIRQEALQTQEMLIVPEEPDIGEKMPEPKEQVPEPEEEPSVVSTSALDMWAEFKEDLTQIELEALKLILSEQDMNPFLIQNKIMLEVLVDGINQKAMDVLGDTLLEIEDTILIYEEYKTKLMEVVEYEG